MKSTIILTFFLVFCSAILSTTATCHRFGHVCGSGRKEMIAGKFQPDNFMSTLKKCTSFCRQRGANYVVFMATKCLCYGRCKNPTKVRSRRVIVTFPLGADPDKICQ
ncbi:hypothetical protein TCAL_12776 [Tigriopus californicus]|uniref:WSC domain-containing protein n=1 Tax=Tigriopus californicus TaxID=6832 RepID=A0A553PTK5_TIGCA|nr:hypothetical protein TCAL_12776 [Tigriopus californicus]|eukprot:TCALIF_12776-PA protein Name:"Protein of unknown function" AED:0.06 eAED:0.06 QI:0/1/0.5/1/1/0.5/2/72/106